MDGLNHSVISGECPGCVEYKAKLKGAQEKLEAVKEWNKGKARPFVSATLDRILKGGD